MGALEEKDADDAFLSQELSDSVKSMALAGKSLFMELREKRRTKPKQDNPSEEELKVFCERTQAVARAAGYPSPETIISLKELVDSVNNLYNAQVSKSGYREYRAKLEKEDKSAADAALKTENLKRFCEIDFDKKCVPDAWLHDALINFNKARAAALQLYGKNGLLNESLIGVWLTSFGYGVDESFIVEENGAKHKVIARTPHSVDAVVRSVRSGAGFLLESLVDQLINAPHALPVYKQDSELVERGSRFEYVPALKPFWAQTTERPSIESDFSLYADEQKNVALLLEKASAILQKMHDTAIAGLLAGVANDVMNYNKSSELPDEDSRHRLLASLWESIAAVKGLPFDKLRAYSLSDVSGEKIEVVSRAAELYHERLRELVATDHLVVGQPYFLEITRDSRTVLAGGIKESETKLSKELIASWIERCFSDGKFMLSAYHSDHPFAYIGKSLECFGVPETHAREFEIVAYEKFFRDVDVSAAVSDKERAPERSSHELFDEEENKFIGSVYLALFEEKDGAKFAKNLRLVMEILSGKQLPSFYATCFVKNKDDDAVRRNQQYSNGIWQEIMVSGTDTAGNLVEIDRVNFHKGDTPLVKRFETAYPEHDLYIGGNKGVAWVFDIDMGWPKNPEISRIELLDENKEQSLDNLVDYLQLAFHETRHIGQIGSRLMWRYVGVAVAEFFASYALQKYDAGVLDKEAYFSDFNVFEGSDIQTTDVFGSELAHPRTLREHVLKWFSIFAAQSLGTGTRAELLRKHGPFKGSLWYDDDGSSADPRRFALNESNGKEEQAILESAVYDITSAVPWEVSKTAHLVGKVLMAINDLERNAGLNPASREVLQKLLYNCRHAKTEFSTIIETDAEVSGLYCTRSVVSPRFSAGERAYQKKFNSLTAGGLLGKKAGEILESSMTAEEKELALRTIGVQYARVYDSDFALKTVPENLKNLGFDAAQDAYNNIDVLAERMPVQNMNWKDVLTPMNKVRVDIQRRYRGNITDFMSVVEKIGYKNAVQIFENAESVDDVVKEIQ